MAKYLVLIYGNEGTWAGETAAWHEANTARHQAFIAAAGTSIVGGNELEPTARAVSIRADSSGKASATDGPFLETKEIVGGYYLLDAPDLAEAIRLARLIPEATGTHAESRSGRSRRPHDSPFGGPSRKLTDLPDRRPQERSDVA